MSLVQAEDLLKKIRPGVSDFFSITAAHFINGGTATIRHFQFLVNTIIKNIELASIEELNKVHAIILHKGHKKDKTLASSYRTISSCPFTAKAVDIYLEIYPRMTEINAKLIHSFKVLACLTSWLLCSLLLP